MEVIVDLLGMTGSQAGKSLQCAALPITSALRFWPLGPFGMAAPHRQSNADVDRKSDGYDGKEYPFTTRFRRMKQQTKKDKRRDP